MSVLWRCGVSKNTFFDQISLGSFEGKLKEMILSSCPGSDDEFSMLFFKFNIPNADVLHPPHRARLDNGINGYRLFFFNAEVFIKVDRRPIGGFGALILSPKQPLVVSLKEPPEVIRLLNESRDDKGV